MRQATDVRAQKANWMRKKSIRTPAAASAGEPPRKRISGVLALGAIVFIGAAHPSNRETQRALL